MDLSELRRYELFSDEKGANTYAHPEGHYVLFADIEQLIAPPPDAWPDVDEAWERIYRAHLQGDDDVGFTKAKAELARILAARPTREAVPEADADPVTDAWLESLGFRENEQDDGHCISDGRLTLNLHGNGDVLVEDCENSVWLGDHYTSRGHVRRLLAALGLRLAGPADANPPHSGDGR